MYVTYVQICPLLYLTLFSSRACKNCEGDCFCESLCLSVYHHSLWHILHSPGFKPDWTRQIFFTRHCCILWEFIFCPLMKADTGTKLVSVLIMVTQWSLLSSLYFWLGGWRDEKGYIFFSFFLCSTLQQPLSIIFLLYIYWVWCWYKDIIMRRICVYL